VANLQHYSFWLWQYEVRSDKPIQYKRFRNKNNADPNLGISYVDGVEIKNKISPDMILQWVINGTFDPIGPSLSDDDWFKRSCHNISRDVFIPAIYNKDAGNFQVEIDCLAPIEKLIPELKMIIVWQKHKVSQAHCKTQEEIDELSNECNEILESAKNELDEFLVNDKATIQKDGDRRAIGLWLFDYCKDNSCGSPAAIEALRKTGYLKRLKYEDENSDKQRQLRSLLKNSRLCIETCEVIPITR
jgi:hypothetical protein